MRILAIDPGPTRSGYVLFANGKLLQSDDCLNGELELVVRNAGEDEHTVMVVEKPALIGQTIWHQVLDTCIWVGELKQMFGPHKTYFLTRQEVKKCILGKANVKAADKHIIQAMMERFPGGKGTKKNPGPLYGIKGDAWQALGLCMTFVDLDLPLMGIM